MRGRDPDERHRVSTPLELLFDLCFVVAVGVTASAYHHDLAEGHVGHAIASYLLVFFTIWWPWVNFTWFASAFDTDDVPYRLLTFVQMVGILVVTAGVPAVFEALDFRVVVIGYVIMRSALVAQWLRCAVQDPAGRGVALRFAAGIATVQLLWIGRLAIDGPLGIAGILVIGAGELLVPVWAERSGRPTPWHPEHVAERYGLFTIIVLGECVLAASTAVGSALDADELTGGVVAIGLSGLSLVFALWWSYFKVGSGLDGRPSMRGAFAWGYGHYAVFAAVAALGAGLGVATDVVLGHAEIGPVGAAASVAVPIAIYLVAVTLLHAWPLSREGAIRVLATGVGLAVAVLLADPLGLPASVALMAVLVAILLAVNLVAARPAPLATTEASTPASPPDPARAGEPTSTPAVR
jgi:low temperature requirement protein LtrA